MNLIVEVRTESTSPITVRTQVELLYGPPDVLFDVEFKTLVRKPAPGQNLETL